MGVDRLRVAEVWSAAGRVGSGYRVSDRLVLTAAHVIGGADGPEATDIGVRPLGERGWLSASLQWADRELDAALVRIESPGWTAPAGESTVRWGRAGGGDPLFCMAVGFPWAAERPNGVRDTEQLYGDIAPLGGLVSGLSDVNVSSAAPAGRPEESPWAGMSGAALVVASYLVGLIVVDPARYGTDRVRVRPAGDLVGVADFRTALIADGATLPAECEVLGDRWRLQLHDNSSVGLETPYRPLPRTPGPAHLLQPQYGLVPYLEREDMINALVDWCERGDAYPRWLCLVTGQGGSGKTRLAAEVCTRLLAAGWDAGFSHEPEPADTLRHRLEHPTLVVIDDADLKPALIEKLVNHVRADLDGPPARLLLLARHLGDQPDSEGKSTGVGWWAQLNRTLQLDPIFEGQLNVSDHPLDAASRARHYQAALAALRPHVPSPVTGPSSPPALGDPSFGQPLLVHMAALIAVYGDPWPDPEPPGLLRRGAAETVTVRTQVLRTLLGREAKRWKSLAGDIRFETSAVFTQGVALGTMTAAADRPTATELLRVMPDLHDALGERLGALADWGHRLYSGGAWWNPIRPDPLAEQHLADTPALPELVLALAARATPDGRPGVRILRQLLGELTRAAPAQPVVRDALQQLIDRELAALVKVCLDTADPALALLLSQALRLCPNPAAAAAVSPLIEHSLALADLAVELAGEAVTHQRHQGSLPDLAGSLNNQSNWLAALGQLEQALAAINEAVDIRRQLADASPGTFLPGLAASLTNQSNRLAALGQRERALTAIDEAVAAYRQLGHADPGAFLLGLARSLNNQSNQLAALGRREQALTAIDEAVAVYRRLDKADPGRFLPDLAASMTNLSTRLGALGRREQALAAIDEAAAAYRSLAETYPDAYQPELATSLGNQSSRLADLGRLEQALEAIAEAVAIQRQLAAFRPDAFLPDLAGSLTNQSNRLADLGQREQALQAIAEAVAIQRQLAAFRPDAVLPELAGSLSSQSNRLASLGQRDKALAVISEAVTIQRQLASDQPDAFLPDLAGYLSNQSACLWDVGQPDGALAAISEAVTIQRQLAASIPGAFLPDLASSLNTQCWCLGALDQWEKALAAIGEAVAIYRDLATGNPQAFLPQLAMSLATQSASLGSLSRPEEARAPIDEAVAIYRDLARARPQAFLPDLASSLNNQARLLGELGQREEALAAAGEAVTIRRGLAEAHRDAFLPELARSLIVQSVLLAEIGHHDGAVQAGQEAVCICLRLQRENPAPFSELASAANESLLNELRQLGHSKDEAQQEFDRLIASC